MSNLAQIVRTNINRLIDEKRISRAELARRMGWHQPSVVRMLNDDKEIMTGTLEKVAMALDVPVIDLMVDPARIGTEPVLA